MRRSAEKKKYNTAIVFDKEMVAPCGMNCGSCLGYMRTVNHCPGCRAEGEAKPAFCRECIVINCELLRKTESNFCYECPKYPCRRLKNRDKRYKTRYNTSFFSNLDMIKEKGMEHFLAFETERRRCPQCGSTLCIHRTLCLECGFSNPVLPHPVSRKASD
jgi:nickel-dependent lactate racemase